MPEIQDARLSYFERLQEAAQAIAIPGLVWSAGTTLYGTPGCVITRQLGGQVAHVDVIWQAPHIATYLSMPYPGAEAYYRVTFVRIDRKNICFPNETGCVTTEVNEVLAVLAGWRNRAPEVAAQRGSAIGKATLNRLKAIAAARKQAVAEPSLVEMDAATVSYAGLSAVEADEMRRRIAVDYPRDDDGRLPLGAVLLLAPMGEPPSNELLRSDWLVAAAPLKRRDAQVVKVEIHSVIPANHPYRWDSMPSMWNPKLTAATEAERWGIDGLTFDGVSDPMAEIERLRKVCTKGGGAEVDRARLSTLLQDAGLFGEAFALYGIEANDDVWRIASGDMLHTGMERLQEPWSEAMCDALWRCAPWKVAKLIADRSAMSKKPPRFRLFALPMQPQQSKTSLMLTAVGKARTPTFDVEGVGSNLRLAEWLWQRPVDLDLRRFGLE